MFFLQNFFECENSLLHINLELFHFFILLLKSQLVEFLCLDVIFKLHRNVFKVFGLYNLFAPSQFFELSFKGYGVKVINFLIVSFLQLDNHVQGCVFKFLKVFVPGLVEIFISLLVLVFQVGKLLNLADFHIVDKSLLFIVSVGVDYFFVIVH